MPKQLGETRNVPDKQIDTWIYKVKDVEIDRLDYDKGDPDDPMEKKRSRMASQLQESPPPSKQKVTHKAKAGLSSARRGPQNWTDYFDDRIFRPALRLDFRSSVQLNYFGPNTYSSA